MAQQNNSSAQEELHIHLLGPFEVYRGAKLIPDKNWRSQNAKGLFAYLVRYGLETREKLMAAFWPEHDYTKARNNLCSTIRYVREAVGPSYIVYRNGRYAFVPLAGYTLDVQEFRRCIVQARRAAETEPYLAARCYRAAVKLYRGDYMEGFYHDWVLWDQEWLRYEYLEALESLATINYERGEYSQAIEYCYKLLQVDRCWEEAYRILIRSWLKLGRKDQAIRYARLVHETLERELGLSPTPETEELCEFVLRGS